MDADFKNNLEMFDAFSSQSRLPTRRNTLPCETCRVLSDAVQDAANRLAAVAERIAHIAGKGEPASFAAASRDMQSLQNECEEARLELQRHRAEHQPAP
jgi:hypothetical protein